MFQKRIQGIFDKARAGGEVKENIIHTIYEQTYDTRADLNSALTIFCQVSSTVSELPQIGIAIFKWFLQYFP